MEVSTVGVEAKTKNYQILIWYGMEKTAKLTKISQIYVYFDQKPKTETKNCQILVGFGQRTRYCQRNNSLKNFAKSKIWV
jgi:hypothetical protein